jgi:hypothetical protein
MASVVQKAHDVRAFRVGSNACPIDFLKFKSGKTVNATEGGQARKKRRVACFLSVTGEFSRGGIRMGDFTVWSMTLEKKISGDENAAKDGNS